MYPAPNTFPINGIIGIVANHADEVGLALKHHLASIEVRADLLMAGGMSTDGLNDLVRSATSKGLDVLVTVRHRSQGGKFDGTESERVAINKAVLAAGANIVDVEWGTQAARDLLAANLPVILSYHNFSAMESAADLETLTHNMLADNPAAIKVVPTAETLEHATRMLRWVEEAMSGNSNSQVRRIGFAMGEAGACSRILTIAYGAPVTYASFGAPVAPGQIELSELQNLYHCDSLNSSTQVVGVVGSASTLQQAKRFMSSQLQQKSKANNTPDSSHTIVPLRLQDLTNIPHLAPLLRLSGIYIDAALTDKLEDYSSGTLTLHSSFDGPGYASIASASQDKQNSDAGKLLIMPAT